MAFTKHCLLVALLLIPAACVAAPSTTTNEAAPKSLKAKFLPPEGSPAQDIAQTSSSEDSSPDSPSKASSPDASSGNVEMTAAAMEAALTDLMLGKTAFGATPMGGSVKKIENLLTKDMMPKVLAAHKADQQQLYRLRNAILKCGRTKAGSLRKAAPAKRDYNRYSSLHKSCRRGQAVAYSSQNACISQQQSLYKEKVLRCNFFSSLSKKFGEQKSNIAIVRKAGSEKTQQYIQRISMTICGRHVHCNRGQCSKRGGYGGGLAGGFLDQYLRAKEKCQIATRRYNSKVRECKKKYAAYQVKRGKCNQYQQLMDSNSCKNAVMVKDTCEAYATCYYTKRNDYRRFERTTKQMEIDRKAEWRGLKRMHCLITAFADGKVTNSEVEACKKKTVDTKLLNIKYPKVPPLQKCTVPSLYPSTGNYKRKEFHPLPTLAKGMQSARCSGMGQFSTKPRSGSPKGTKCSRVSLRGFYSAGALIKCVNGIATRKSKDKNSCPRGTKIFSPRSRSDWTTFMASAGPLRAPHWIIDITRPQRGCGGCKNNVMNSKNRNQRTWQTSDGSPWWLRSTRTGQPDGDYYPNCYMDLWRNHLWRRNPNNVLYNDYNCNYHSKSYYCQPIALDLKPKSGSGAACKCSKVELSGKYLAGFLVKCTQCRTVYKSTQKNSCPNGMKIFSPASRGDWKTFLASAVPLYAPNWIIDITRPSRGCGGCKKYSMKSSSPQQATWRTADGSPWWLRSTTYSEPNGDYYANCFLAISGKPTSPDTVRFNDHNCNYRSRSYYCQPTRTNKNYGGHHRRRVANRVAKRKPMRKPTKPKRLPPKPKRKGCKGSNCQCRAVLYKHANFGGSRGTFFIGNYDFKQFTKKVKNDDVSSIFVYGRNCVAEMYEHGGFKGWKAKYATGGQKARGWRYVGNHRNDKASSLKVYQDNCKAILYQHSNFRGYRGTFTSGSYNYHQFIRRVRNDDISSLKVFGKGCYADLFEHGSFNGWRMRIATGKKNYRGINYVGNHRNDRVSSLRVFKR